MSEDLYERMVRQRERNKALEHKRGGGGDFFKPEVDRKYLIAIPPPPPDADLSEDTQGLPFVMIQRWNKPWGAKDHDRIPQLPLMACVDTHAVLEHPAVVEALKEREKKDDVDLSTDRDAIEDVKQQIDDECADISNEIGGPLDDLFVDSSQLMGMYLVAETKFSGAFADTPPAKQWQKKMWFLSNNVLDQIIELTNDLPRDKATKKRKTLWDTKGMIFIILTVKEEKQKGGKTKRVYSVKADPDTQSEPYIWTKSELQMLDEDQAKGGALNYFTLIARMVKPYSDVMSVLKGGKRTRSREEPPKADRRRNQDEDDTSSRRRNQDDEEAPRRPKDSEDEGGSRRRRAQESEEEPARESKPRVQETEEEPSSRRRRKQEDDAEPEEQPRRRAKAAEEKEEEPATRRRSRVADEDPPKDSPKGGTHEAGDDDDDDFDAAIRRAQEKKRSRAE